jgi:hypothetical protein
MSVAEEDTGSSADGQTLAEAKWGDALGMGFVIVPGVLIRAQEKLGLDPTDLAILLNILLHWWKPGDWPYPPPSLIARRIGVSTRTVERRLESLQERNFLIRHGSEKSKDGLAQRRIELTGLVLRLQAFARAGLEMRNDINSRGARRSADDAAHF